MQSPVFSSSEEKEGFIEPSPDDDDAPPSPPPEDSSSFVTDEIPDLTPVSEADDGTATATQDQEDILSPQTTDSEPTSTPAFEVSPTTSEPEFPETPPPSPTESLEVGPDIGPHGTSKARSTTSKLPKSFNNDSLITITTTDARGDSVTITSSVGPENSANRLNTATNGAAGTLPSQSPSPQPSPRGNSGLSGGEIAAAVIVPMVLVALLLLGIFLYLRRRRRQTPGEKSDDDAAIYQSSASEGDGNPSMSEAPPFTMTGDTRNVTRGYGTGIDLSDVSTGTPGSTPLSSALSPPQAVATGDAQRNPLENVRTGPPPASAASAGSLHSTFSDAWHSSSASDPFNDSRGGTGYGSNHSVTWSNFSGAGTGHNAATGYTSSSSNKTGGPSRVSSVRGQDRPSENDEALSVVSSLSDTDVQDVEVRVAQRASVIDSKGISRPK
ncbi:MAG: hypothetical protein M1831_005982 [Alyxoria varia]|nr:MAG: hypothetical protein M1831_005982 [Alyxoria varia]